MHLQNTLSISPCWRSSPGAPGPTIKVRVKPLSLPLPRPPTNPPKKNHPATPSLPRLSDAQSHKLRQLSLLTLSTSPYNLTYENLLSELSLPDIRALEDLVISNIYAGLLSAKLDTLAKRVDVSSVAPLRDLRPESVPEMVAVLDDWDKRCIGVLREIEKQVREVRRKAEEVRARDIEDERAFERAMEYDGKDKGKAAGKRGARDAADRDSGIADGGDEMDVDEGAGRGRPRATKRGGGRFVGIAKKLSG